MVRKHLHCWLMQRHRKCNPGGDLRAKYCTKCCWCSEPRGDKPWQEIP